MGVALFRGILGAAPTEGNKVKRAAESRFQASKLLTGRHFRTDPSSLDHGH
jgi:hypothetical protein